MQINRCPKCGGKPIIIPKLSDDREGRVISYRLGCLHCEMFVSMNMDLTNVAEAVAKWNEMTNNFSSSGE
jgi:hypothetical protein